MNIHPAQSRTNEEGDLENVVEMYSNILFRLCFTILRNSADAEDAVSETFIKYLTKAPAFLEEEHRKAWLIRVATNTCRDLLRANKYRDHLELNEINDYAPQEPDRGILESVMNLPEKYRTLIVLHYIEGYGTAEIAEMLSLKPSAVRKRLQYARTKLKVEYERED